MTDMMRIRVFRRSCLVDRHTESAEYSARELLHGTLGNCQSERMCRVPAMYALGCLTKPPAVQVPRMSLDCCEVPHVSWPTGAAPWPNAPTYLILHRVRSCAMTPAWTTWAVVLWIALVSPKAVVATFSAWVLAEWNSKRTVDVHGLR